MRTYGIHSWDDPVDFLNQLAIKMGRLLKKGEPDMRTAARMVLNDCQRGKLPYYTEPPKATEDPRYVKKEACGYHTCGYYSLCNVVGTLGNTDPMIKRQARVTVGRCRSPRIISCVQLCGCVSLVCDLPCQLPIRANS